MKQTKTLKNHRMIRSQRVFVVSSENLIRFTKLILHMLHFKIKRDYKIIVYEKIYKNIIAAASK